MISKYNERITITIDKNLLAMIEMDRGWKTRTQYICEAIDEKLHRQGVDKKKSGGVK